MRIKTKRKLPKTKVVSKPRENRAYLKGRIYKDYLDYMAIHKSASVVEMDTVYNDVSNGPFIQTFQIVDLNLMIGLYYERRTTECIMNGVAGIKKLLQKDFSRLFQVLLTDRGSEFFATEEFEELGCKIFYCDEMQSCQKPHVENNQIYFYI